VSVEIVTRPYADAFASWAEDRPEVLALSADLTNSCEIGQWRDTHPDRFFSFGMGEQNMLGFAAGLAREGFRPFVHTFAVFLYRRPYDQLAMSIAYPNLPVRLVGFLPGITTPGGVTHQAIEDVAVLRAMPNMTVLETGDATEVQTVLEAADSVDGPVYIRIRRARCRACFHETSPSESECLDCSRRVTTSRSSPPGSPPRKRCGSRRSSPARASRCTTCTSPRTSRSAARSCSTRSVVPVAA